MLKYFQIIEQSEKLSNILGTYAESALPKTEGKYMGEREHLLQAEIYLRQCIKSLEDAHSISIRHSVEKNQLQTFNPSDYER